jgi:hypothetical protein
MMINLTAPNQPEPPLILTIDIGTSSTRALVYDRLGRRVEGVLAQIPHHLHTTADGGAELDPSELLESVIQAIDQALQQTGALAEKIGGVAMDTLVTNIIGLDRNGTPVTPIFTYADTRGRRLIWRPCMTAPAAGFTVPIFRLDSSGWLAPGLTGSRRQPIGCRWGSICLRRFLGSGW